MKNKKQPVKPLHKFLRLSGVGIQMGVTLYIAAYFGKKLDLYFGYDKLLSLVFVLVAFLISMYSLLQQLKRLQD